MVWCHWVTYTLPAVSHRSHQFPVFCPHALHMAMRCQSRSPNGTHANWWLCSCAMLAKCAIRAAGSARRSSKLGILYVSPIVCTPLSLNDCILVGSAYKKPPASDLWRTVRPPCFFFSFLLLGHFRFFGIRGFRPGFVPGFLLRGLIRRDRFFRFFCSPPSVFHAFMWC